MILDSKEQKHLKKKKEKGNKGRKEKEKEGGGIGGNFMTVKHLKVLLWILSDCKIDYICK